MPCKGMGLMHIVLAGGASCVGCWGVQGAWRRSGAWGLGALQQARAADIGMQQAVLKLLLLLMLSWYIPRLWEDDDSVCFSCTHT